MEFGRRPFPQTDVDLQRLRNINETLLSVQKTILTILDTSGQKGALPLAHHLQNIKNSAKISRSLIFKAFMKWKMVVKLHKSGFRVVFLNKKTFGLVLMETRPVEKIYFAIFPSISLRWSNKKNSFPWIESKTWHRTCFVLYHKKKPLQKCETRTKGPNKTCRCLRQPRIKANRTCEPFAWHQCHQNENRLDFWDKN